MRSCVHSTCIYTALLQLRHGSSSERSAWSTLLGLSPCPRWRVLFKHLIIHVLTWRAATAAARRRTPAALSALAWLPDEWTCLGA